MADAVNKTIGGGNYFDIYAITDTTGTWTVGTNILLNERIHKTALTGHPKSKNMVIAPDSSYSSAALYTGLLDGYVQEAASTTTATEDKFEDGTGGGTSSGVVTPSENVIGMWSGGTHPTAGRLVGAAIFGVSFDGLDTTADVENRPKVKFTSQECQSDTDITIDSILPADVSATAVKIVKTTHGFLKYLAT